LNEVPVIVVNFKAYAEAEGTGSLSAAMICESISDETGVSIAVCPAMTELGYVARNINIPVFSQNADPYAPGPSTGWITPSMIKSSGAFGTLLNHSEHRQSMDQISDTIRLCKTSDLRTLVCAESADMASGIAVYSPDMIAVEPPELIGGDISVTDADPKVIANTVESVRSVNARIAVFCGAGVKTGKDVRNALDLGADGVLLASGVVRSKDQKASLLDLVKYL